MFCGNLGHVKSTYDYLSDVITQLIWKSVPMYYQGKESKYWVNWRSIIDFAPFLLKQNNENIIKGRKNETFLVIKGKHGQ